MLKVFCAIVLLLTGPALTLAEGLVHHDLRVVLTPDSGRIHVSDNIRLPTGANALAAGVNLALHPALTITAAEPPLTATTTNTGLTHYTLATIPPDGRISLTYEGVINHPLQEQASGLGTSLEATRGFITADGVYLDGNSYWYPHLGDGPVSFTLDIETPMGWSAISQGARGLQETRVDRTHIRWKEGQAQEEIYLIANRYQEYRGKAGVVETLVWLRQADEGLAQRYLAAMQEYIKLYSRLIGPYPYAKFALVENTWESGYGMPSFTLLGPQVIRLPFIVRSSFPHEILHNWWGNGVYVDYAGGNWAEGLTAYLADHLLKEQHGDGPAYRRDALLRYTNYVAAERDFPLAEFRSRHSGASQSIGYDKALMSFHALRLRLGDAAFITALQNFYREHRFTIASWHDLQGAFEQQSTTPLDTFFQQTLHGKGAAALRIVSARSAPIEKEWHLELVVEQTQPGPAHELSLPLYITLEGRTQAQEYSVIVNDKRSAIELQVPARPWRVQLDPEFDVFRRLAPQELPPTLSEALAAERLTIVLPSAAPAAVRQGYQKVAQAWARSGGDIKVVWDSALSALPQERAVWLFGWENRFFGSLRSILPAGDITLGRRAALIKGQALWREDDAVVLSARRDNGQALVWLGNDNAAAFAGLARKLPHYGNASYLAFDGDAPTNFLKGQWAVSGSPLDVAVMQADDAIAPATAAPRAPRPPLSRLDDLNPQ